LKFGIDTARNHADPKEWMAAFKLHISNKQVKDTLIKLAITPISVFTEEWFADPKRSRLLASSVTNFWVGAYRLAGGPWAYPEQSSSKQAPSTPTRASILKTKSPPTKTDKGVSFGVGVKTTKGLFISRNARKPTAAPPKMKADVRKHEDVFYSIECPPMDSDWKEGGTEITAHFTEIVDYILEKDKKAIIHIRGTMRLVANSQENWGL
jgi:hypothetical protein